MNKALVIAVSLLISFSTDTLPFFFFYLGMEADVYAEEGI